MGRWIMQASSQEGRLRIKFLPEVVTSFEVVTTFYIVQVTKKPN